MGQSMAKADDASITPWMPLAEAEACAGSFEALLPRLRDGRILARYTELRFWPSGQPYDGPGDIKPAWWSTGREIDGRLVVTRPRLRPTPRLYILGPDMPSWPDPPPDEVFPIGVELERAAVERLFPTAADQPAALAKPKAGKA